MSGKLISLKLLIHSRAALCSLLVSLSFGNPTDHMTSTHASADHISVRISLLKNQRPFCSVLKTDDDSAWILTRLIEG